jgi:hypothetical protein
VAGVIMVVIVIVVVVSMHAGLRHTGSSQFS